MMCLRDQALVLLHDDLRGIITQWEARYRGYPEVTLEISVPFEAQAAKWVVDNRTCWQECIDRADVMTVLSHEYTKKYFFARNHYLVSQADILLACSDGQESETKNAVEYARQNGCKVCLIPPVRKEYEIRRVC